MKDYKVCVLAIVNDELNDNTMNETSLKIVSMLGEKGLKTVSFDIIPNNKKTIYDKIVEVCDSKIADIVLVTADRKARKKYIVDDIIESIIEKENTVIDEKIRQYVLINTSGKISLDGVAGTRNKTLIINIPENIKNYLSVLLDSAVKEFEKEIAS